MKLPPPNLVQEYFEYYALENDTDRIIYRKQHRLFDRWGMETKGWVNALSQKVSGPDDPALMKLYREFQKIPGWESKTKSSAALDDFRRKHLDLNYWLVFSGGYKLLTMPKPAPTMGK